MDKIIKYWLLADYFSVGAKKSKLKQIIYL